MSRDGKLIHASKATRTVFFGYLGVALGIYLHELGAPVFVVGAVLMLAMLGSAFSTALVAFFADRLGRRRTLVAFSVLMTLGGALLSISSDVATVAVAAFLGSLSVTGTEAGPFSSLEQAILPQAVEQKRRNVAFGVYNLVGYACSSFGSTLAWIPERLQGSGLEVAAAFRPLFVAYTAAGVVLCLLYLSMGKGIEPAAPAASGRKLTPESRATIARLSGLFAVDALGGGFVVQSVISLWFYLTFGVGISSVGDVFAVAYLITAASFLAAAKIADRIGLLRTMVFTHIPSNLLLMAIPLSPTFHWAAALLFARQSMSQMDVPTRQAYIVQVVEPEARTPASSFTTLSRNVSAAFGPSMAGYVLQQAMMSTPFFVAGGLKTAYDVAVYLAFRKVKLKG